MKIYDRVSLKEFVDESRFLRKYLWMIERGRAKDLINATNKSYEVINISSVLQKSSNYFRLRYRNEFEEHEILQPYLKNLRNIPLCCKTAPSNYL